MLTAVPEPKSELSVEDEPKLPDESSLQDRMPDSLKAPRTLFFFTAAIGAFYWYLNAWPLWHTDLWGHLAYGRLIWQTGALPQTEPLMPLAAGVRYIDTAWLSQLIGFRVHESFGAPALHFLFAAAITFCISLLSWRIYGRHNSKFITGIGIVTFVWVGWEHLPIIRPQLAGLVCFVSLLMLMTSRRWLRANWILVPLLFAVWANLHGSFPVGLLALGCYCAGHAGDVLRRTRRVGSIFRDRRVRRLFFLTELAALAVLLNPYGLRLYPEVLAFSAHENLSVLVEWEPLSLRMRQGRAFAVAALALMFVYRMTPRRISTTEILILVGLGAATLWTSRMIVWWAPVAAYYLALHAGAIWKRIGRNRPAREPESRSGTWGVASIGFAWICFAYTSFGLTLLHGPQDEMNENLSPYTPVAAVAYLNEHPPAGQIFNSYEWGDYLVWAGPSNLQIFVASHAHLVPREVWQDYLNVSNTGADWNVTLDRYGINTIVVDTMQRGLLIARLREETGWKVDYEDDLAVIFTRTNPL